MLSKFGRFKSVVVAAALLVSSLAPKASADQVEMKNGDRYVGQVVSLSTDTLVMKNDVLGTVKLPRDKVSQVSFGTNVVATIARPATTIATQAPPAKISSKAANLLQSPPTSASPTNVMLQVQQQLLSDTSPQAKAKYQELASGFLSGTISETQIRAEAQSAVEQLKKFKTELGDEDVGELDGYLTILENFLNETKPDPVPALPPAKSKP